MIFTGASAQFEAGTKYIGASLSGLSLQYSSNERMRFNLDGAAGLFVSDGLLVYANFGYGHTRYTDDITAGLNGRFYFNKTASSSEPVRSSCTTQRVTTISWCL